MGVGDPSDEPPGSTEAASTLVPSTRALTHSQYGIARPTTEIQRLVVVA